MATMLSCNPGSKAKAGLSRGPYHAAPRPLVLLLGWGREARLAGRLLDAFLEPVLASYVV